MADRVDRFEEIARRVLLQHDERHVKPMSRHPFDLRGIHPRVSETARQLFDNRHYVQATFEAFKLVEMEVRQASRLSRKSGASLMMAAFSQDSPKVRLNDMSSQSETDEQKGFMFLFAGAMLAIRNPRAHDAEVESPDECLEHLGLASLLLRRLDAARRVN